MTELANAKFDPVDLLASMMFADSNDQTFMLESSGKRFTGGKLAYEEIDAGAVLHLNTMTPKRAYTFDMVDRDRLFAIGPEYLMRHPAETIGRESEIVILKDDSVYWVGLRRVNKTPKGVWISKPRSVLYECHHRQIFPDGNSTYNVRIAAVDTTGHPVQSIIVGSTPKGARPEGEMVVMSASMIEDCYRAGAIRCELTDGNTIISPVENGEQKGLFALRDGPVTAKGRRRAILHYVMRHIRRSASGTECNVRDHFRGVAEFTVDGLKVRLTANDAGDAK